MSKRCSHSNRIFARNLFLAAASLLWLGALQLRATELYVATNGNDSGECLTWETAARTIQFAVDLATDSNDTVWVSNGVYNTGGRTHPGAGDTTNRLVITNAITVQGFYGPDQTIIQGAWASDGTTNGADAVRCVFMHDRNARLSGFTLTNGATTVTGSGGGVLGGRLDNCTLIGNAAYQGGGAASSVLFNCTISGNSTLNAGGGALKCTISNSTLVANSAGGYGGGASSCYLYNCALTSNTTARGGGGSASATNYNCVITRNWATGGVAGGGVYGGAHYNCVIAGNHAGLLGTCDTQGGGAGFAYLTNCTIIRNTAGRPGGGTYKANLVNCIVYYNWSRNLAKESNVNDTTITNTCTTPGDLVVWTDGCTSNDPAMFDSGSGYGTNFTAGTNYRLVEGSPCINTGTNFAWMTAPGDIRSRDMDGLRRVQYERVDMGAYEFLYKGGVFLSR